MRADSAEPGKVDQLRAHAPVVGYRERALRHVLIDSPPLINCFDSVILSRLVDGVMLVVHNGKSSRQLVRRARQELASVGAKVFGVVLNNVDMRNEGYDGYYGRNAYRYGAKETTAS